MTWSAQINGPDGTAEQHEGIIEALREFVEKLHEEVSLVEARFSGQHHPEVNLLAPPPPPPDAAAEPAPPTDGGTTSLGTTTDTADGGESGSGVMASEIPEASA